MRMRRFRARSGGERGAVALMVSVSLIALFGFVALSVDIGNAWQNRRQLVNATDASALAAAQEYALNGNGCGAIATTYVNNNKDNATIVECDPSAGALAGATSGDVLIKAESTVEYAFAPVIGKDSDVLSATTMARYGIPLAAGGLRPFGLCYEAIVSDPVYIGFLNKDPYYAPYELLMEYDKSAQPNACNGGDPVPGNWGMMDLDGGANSNSDTQYWTVNGYDEYLEPSPIPGDTGAFSPSLASELQTLVDSQIPFPIPLFISATGGGSGAVFDMVGYVTVQLVDFNTSGSQNNRWLEIRFVDAVIEGACCDASGIDTGTRVVQICGFDGTDRSKCVVS